MAGTQLGRPKSAPTLLNLCLGVVGSHLEDLVPHLADIALDFPSEIKVPSFFFIIVKQNPCRM